MIQTRKYEEFERNRSYLHMTNEELVKEYSPSQWSRTFSPDEVVNNHITSCRLGTELSKKEFDHEQVVYGPGPNQKLDIFAPGFLPKDAPIFVYFHGGYWQALCAEFSSFAARNVLKAGGVHVTVGYDLAPQATMSQMVSQAKQAVEFVVGLAKTRCSRGIYIGGHSAGGHLAAMMMCQNWHELIGEDAKYIKGALLISGVFDLRPLLKTYVNEPIKMTEEEAWLCSPWNPTNLDQFIKTTVKSKCSITIAIGAHESTEFRRQSDEFNQVLQSNGLLTKLVDVPDVDHFDVSHNLSQPDYTLTKVLMDMIELV